MLSAVVPQKVESSRRSTGDKINPKSLIQMAENFSIKSFAALQPGLNSVQWKHH